SSRATPGIDCRCGASGSVPRASRVTTRATARAIGNSDAMATSATRDGECPREPSQLTARRREMEASVRQGALTSPSSVLVREGFDLDTLTEFQGCRFGVCDLDRQDPGVDRPPGILRADAAGHHGVGDLFHLREPGRALEALGGDPDLRAEGDP